jgi:hypothetical protein
MSYKISTIHKLHNSKYQFTLIIRCLFIYIMYNSKQQQLNKKMSFLGLRRKRKNWILVLLYTIFHIIFLFIVVQRKRSNFSAISWREQVNFQWDDDEVRFVLDQHAELDFYSASSLKQQSTDRHVAPLWHIILILSQPVFAHTPYCCVLSGEATNTNFIVFGLTRTHDLLHLRRTS